MVATGVLRSVENDSAFFDVLTVLRCDETERMARKFNQGAVITAAVSSYIKSESADPNGYAGRIPVLPFSGNDFASRFVAGGGGGE